MHDLHQGRNTAYTAIHDRYVTQLCYFIRSITGSKEAAEDIASESFVKVFRRTETFETVTQLKHYLFKVASNGALDYVKIEKRYRDHLGRWKNNIDQWTDDIHKKYIEAEAVTAVYRELNKLPTQVREVLRLSLFESRTLEEISNQMGIALKTVKNHKTRGLAMLRSNLINDESIGTAVLAVGLAIASATF